MKATIENPIQFFNETIFNETLMQFARILQDITTAKDIDEMRANLDYSKHLRQTSNFLYGFGGSHLWVKQIHPDSKAALSQIIFVEF